MLWPVLIEAAGTGGPNSGQAAVMCVLLLSARQLDEVAGMKWDDIDFITEVWTQSSNKSDRLHLVPLVPTALALIDARKYSRGYRSDYVFTTSAGGRLIDGVGNWTRLTRAWAAAAGMELEGGKVDWHRHDLRRTVATKLAELGVSGEVIEGILNHAPPGSAVARIYNRHVDLKARRQALLAIESYFKVVAPCRPTTSCRSLSRRPADEALAPDRIGDGHGDSMSNMVLDLSR